MQEKEEQLQVRLNLEQLFIQAQEQYREQSYQVSYKFVGKQVYGEFDLRQRSKAFGP